MVNELDRQSGAHLEMEAHLIQPNRVVETLNRMVAKEVALGHFSPIHPVLEMVKITKPHRVVGYQKQSIDQMAQIR